MAQLVDKQYLLKGAVYALEQCGLLLHDANVLYKAGSYANAVVLAAFAREELGRWKLLLKLREARGKQLTVEDVKQRCAIANMVKKKAEADETKEGADRAFKKVAKPTIGHLSSDRPRKAAHSPK